MRDELHATFHDELERLADEVHAQHIAGRIRARRTGPQVHRDSEHFAQSEYAGLKRVRLVRKYRDCEYVDFSDQLRVRKLTEREIGELQAHVDRVARR